MDQAMSDLAAPDQTAPCLSAAAPCYNKPEGRATLHQDTFNSAGVDFVWVALPGVRMKRRIIGNQNWKAPRVRHRRIP